MLEPPAIELTKLLSAWSEGDKSAFEKLFPLIERELHLCAHRYMSRERSDHTLQPTALVNEAYLKLINQKVRGLSKAHFLGIAAQIMRRIVIDHARKHLSAEHGGGKTISIEDVAIVSTERATELLAIDEALNSLANVDQCKARIVELRYFGGLHDDEIAEVLDISTASITREWRLAKVFLRRELGRSCES